MLNFRQFREARNLTQQEVEEATGVPQRTISGIEGGAAPAGPTLLALLTWHDNLVSKLKLQKADEIDWHTVVGQ